MKLGNKQTLEKLISQKDPCRINNVAFFGGADIDHNHPVFRQAYRIAQAVAKEGKTVVNGGGPGVMEAATLGAQSAGGKTITVAFQPSKEDMPGFSEESDHNYPDVKIKLNNLMKRQLGLIDLADLYIVFKGGTGTLSEWAMVWLFAHLRNGHHKPIILYGEFWQEVMAIIDKHFILDDSEKSVCSIATNEIELLKQLYEAETMIANRCL